MSNETVAAALADLVQKNAAYKDSCDTESIRAAEKQSADAALATATAMRQADDTALEASLATLIAELATIGITLPV